MELIPNMSSVEKIEATTTTEDNINFMKRFKFIFKYFKIHVF